MKAGYAALVGRPNAGKSTLLNRLVGQKVAIVSDKPQTTRHRILGVWNGAGGQIVFLDTPGIHRPRHRLNRRMVDAALESLRGVDVAVLVADATGRAAGDRYVIDALREARVPAVAALNKIDLVRKPDLLPLIAAYAAAFPFRAIVPVSAATGDGLEALTAEILAALPEGDPLFPDEYVTDQSLRTLAAELVRERLLRHTHDELPYTTAVVVDRFEEPAGPGGLTRIFASIVVDQPSQKAIVLGRAGRMIKRIGTEARVELERLVEGRVHLDLHVRVREDWRDDERLLDDLGLGRRR